MMVGMCRQEVSRQVPPGENFLVAARGRSSQYDHDPRIGVIVITLRQATGWDGNAFGAMLSGVYASGLATRIQLAGRLKRIATQKRSVLKYAIVYPQGTILEMLLRRHNSADESAASLDALASRFLSMRGNSA